MSEQYIVRGAVVVDGSQANSTVQRLTQGFTGLQGATARVGSGIMGMAGKVAGLAATFVGVRAAAGQVSGALDFHNELEQSTQGLAALFRTVGHEGFAQSMTHASTAFIEIDEMAASAYGETSDLFGILRAGYADLNRMNVSWEDQKNLIRDVANTAGIVGEDPSFVGRDLQEMLSGRAHMGTNQLFTRVMAPLGIDTESFNALPDAERLAKIQEVMRGMGGGEGAAAIGNSFAAQISTLASKFKMFRESFFAPFFEAVAVGMRRITSAFDAQKTIELMNRLKTVGTALANRLQPVVVGFADKIVYAMQHVDETIAKIKSAFSKLVELTGKLAAIRLAIAVAPMAASALSSAAGGVAAAGSVSGALTAPMAALSALGSALAPLLPVFAVIASLGIAISVNWQRFIGLFAQASPLFAYFGQEAMGMFSSLWEVLSGLGQIIGELLGPGVMLAAAAVFGALIVAFKALKLVFDLILPLITGIKNGVHQIFTTFLDNISDLLVQFGMPRLTGPVSTVAATAAPSQAFDMRSDVRQPFDAVGSARIPSQRVPPPNNDFRGSRINVNQEFKEADPDRVMFQVVNDINRQAERRISSGQTNPLTR